MDAMTLADTVLIAQVAEGWGARIKSLAQGVFRLLVDLSEGFLRYSVQTLEAGGLTERLLIMGIFAIMLFSLSVFLGVFLRNSLRSLPFLKRRPWGMPSSGSYLALPSGFDRPLPFEWKFPLLEIAGDRYDMRYAWPCTRKKLRFELPTGTVIQFVPLEKVTSSSPEA